MANPPANAPQAESNPDRAVIGIEAEPLTDEPARELTNR